MVRAPLVGEWALAVAVNTRLVAMRLAPSEQIAVLLFDVPVRWRLFLRMRTRGCPHKGHREERDRPSPDNGELLHVTLLEQRTSQRLQVPFDSIARPSGP